MTLPPMARGAAERAYARLGVLHRDLCGEVWHITKHGTVVCGKARIVTGLTGLATQFQGHLTQYPPYSEGHQGGWPCAGQAAYPRPPRSSAVAGLRRSASPAARKVLCRL
jgi:hypothetical protein